MIHKRINRTIRPATASMLFSALRMGWFRRLVRGLPGIFRKPLAGLLSSQGYHAQALDLVSELDSASALQAGIYTYFGSSHKSLQTGFTLHEGIAVLSCHPEPLPSAEVVCQWITRLHPKHRSRACAFLKQIGFNEFDLMAKTMGSSASLPSWISQHGEVASSEYRSKDINCGLLKFNELKRADNHNAALSVMEEIFRQENLSKPPSWLFEGNLHDRPEVSLSGSSNHQNIPKITVILCAWNAEKYLSLAISSILDQSYPNIEIIAVNDGSTDSTQEILERFLSNHQQARIVHEVTNHGVYHCRNKALDLATGDYVTFHDADDWSHPLKIELQLQALQSHPGALASSSNYFRIIPETGLCFTRRVFPICRWNCSSFMFHRVTALEFLGFFDSVKAAADSEYVARFEAVFGTHRHIRLKSPLSIGLEHQASLTRAISSGFDQQGLSPTRQSYTETWRIWHSKKAHEIKGLRLEKGQCIQEICR